MFKTDFSIAEYLKCVMMVLNVEKSAYYQFDVIVKCPGTYMRVFWKMSFLDRMIILRVNEISLQVI